MDLSKLSINQLRALRTQVNKWIDIKGQSKIYLPSK